MALPGMDLSVAQAGEWPGAVSGKFTDKFTARPLCRRMLDTEVKHGAVTGLAQNGFGKYFTDKEGLRASESKRVIPMPQSEVCMWRPSKRPLSEPGALHLEKPDGRARVPEPPGRVYSMPEKRHIRQVESKEEYGDRAVGPRVVVRENGLRACDQPAREVDVQNEMQRKNRALDLLSQRNGIGVRSMGDKAYRHPEYMNGFHKAGNLIVGSSFHRGMHAKTVPRNSTSINIVIDTSKPPVKSYMEKLREREVLEAQAEVEELTRNWEKGTLRESKGLECDKSYTDPIDSDSEDEAQSPSAS
eukprot:TRINITY_DN84424_c0_g1_i1.p1 TRINITY_DN84424_c0_g1~~TRINITY_DN84424_c0_g1_i1.p1  ORF type:complete len:313 (+),score=47.82 TRINITY_DN84424_c0_g1_i1:37-939(+)